MFKEKAFTFSSKILFSFQIDSWCKDNSNVIAGYYQANERVKDARYIHVKPLETPQWAPGAESVRTESLRACR